MFTSEYNSLPGEESNYIIPPGMSEDDAHYDSQPEDIVVDYDGNEIVVGDKVKFVIETLDGEEEYWIGYVFRITDFSADADDDGKWYGVTPDVIVEYSFLGINELTVFNTYQEQNKPHVFICEELEIIER